MAFTYTEDQMKVISLRNRNILVSAAAGSGKTTVLVERIIRMISDESHPVDIDRLLIVTFTNAAAAQMREKIGNAITKQLKENPSNVHLQRQATLLHNALITTIHSFCLFLIRNNFNEIGLDPGFRVADEGEIKLIREAVMEQLLEDFFAKEEPAFTRLAERFITGNSMNGLSAVILSLYNQAVSYPFPKEWLADRKRDYALGDVAASNQAEVLGQTEAPSHTDTLRRAEALNQTGWMTLLREFSETTVTECIRITEHTLHLCECADGPYMYAQAVEDDLALLRALQKCARYEDYYTFFQNMAFTRLSAKKDDSVSGSKKEQAKAGRDLVKAMLMDMKKKYYAVSTEGILRGMEQNADILATLTDVTQEFMSRLTAEKREKKLIDFGDMEHLALQILLTKEENQYVPSKAALDYRDYFTEIMVDEYQDSNLVQEWILKTISGEANGHYNRFMVGDVKQSIYKFRLARPELFMEKYDTYSLEESRAQRIDLSRNYRSRVEVVDSANYIFHKIMGRDLGNIEYDKSNALYCGAAYPDNSMGNQTELLLLQRENDSQSQEQSGVQKTESQQKRFPQSKQQQEARMIAAKIRTLVGQFPVTDEKSGELRPAAYGDIVILLRTNSGWDEEFRKVFEEEGIPAYITSRTGYFSANEIRVIMNFLRVLDNPKQDIPLFGTLCSAFGQCSEEEIAAISVCEGHSLYEKVRSCAAYETAGNECQDGKLEADGNLQNGKDSADSSQRADRLYRERRLPVEKCRQFLTFLQKYRAMVSYVPIHKLLRSLLLETGYLYEVTALPGGEQRAANVNMLLEKAETYEKSSYSGLFHFIRYMEKIQKYDVDFGEAGTLEENADVVRIMSIHKSKGLEFPICIVAGLAKQFNKNDTREALICDMDYGTGLDYADTRNRVRYPDLRRKVIAERIRRENLGEELRVLYVALTRAKEKLILSATVDDFTKMTQSFAGLQSIASGDDTGRLPFSSRVQASSYLDLLLPCLLPLKEFQQEFEQYGEFELETDENAPQFQVTLMRMEDLIAGALKQAVSGEVLKKQLLDSLQEQADRNPVNQLDGQEKEQPGEDMHRRLREQLSFTYSHDNLAKLYTKTTVSELKMAAMHAAINPDGQEEKAVELFQTEVVIPCIPRFAKEKEEVSGSTRGSAYHRVMELLDMQKVMKQQERSRREEEISFQLVQFQKNGQLSEEEAAMVRLDKILLFFDTTLAERMARAQAETNLYKEQPFVLGVEASRLSAEFPQEETVLIQGIIDVFFIEEDEIVLMDYKTDVVKTETELVTRYRTQLDYYQESLERIMGKRVKEKLIYSFYLEKVIGV